MNTDQRNYEQLHRLSKEIRTLQGVSSLLDWDQETYMPPKGAVVRAEQLRLLAGIIHQKQISRSFSTALSQLVKIPMGQLIAKTLSTPQKAAVREWRRDFLIAKALPKRFVEKFAKLTSQAIQVWHHAKSQDLFQPFAPFLEQLIRMAQEKAEYLGYKNHPYDALLDQFEPGMTVAEIDPLFNHLRTSIVKILNKASFSQHVDDRFLFGTFSKEKQMQFGHLVLKAMEYDLSKGRLDLSEHPFSSSCHPHDSRITTNVSHPSLMSNISAVMHEAGHGLYEMGLPVEHYGSPLAEPVSHAIHESQSRWWETRIGLSKPFWSHFFPLLKKHFKGKFDKITLDQFYLAINKISPSLIRIQADEVTYSLHVILRYELEKRLIEGSLKVRELPEAWNAKMQELLGITPTNYREGCLQDIHWSMGAFGYFPSYTLGNLAASHLFEAFEKKYKDWEQRVAKGELGFIKEWLDRSVYRYGRQYSCRELLQKVTGKPFSAKAYTTYLTKKYQNRTGMDRIGNR